ncbi:MAG: methionine--tRNA ligase [Deltaproteobacteria bacterium]|nr:methionine--tRNA ligase [Deltaproteobacteria bacterium]MBW2415790.1 methionine--tRNA ligase [Deltaproteobacteria bacterium]
MTTPFYVTTPLYYPNAQPHIGSTYTTAIADTLTRYHRAAGEEVFFVTGTDEHGEKMLEAAREAGLEPKAFVDGMAERFSSTWKQLGFEYDRFIRTTDADHVRAVQHLWQTIYDRGDVEFREYTGRYCVGCEAYLTDRELVDGQCAQHLTEPEERSESNYFFKMTSYFDDWVEHLESHPELVTPTRYRNEALALMKGGVLGDLCITRPVERLTWGIPAPWDDDYVLYVWTDALVNYVTATGYPEAGWEERWSGVHHLIGKDILKPHAVFWPTILRAAGLPLFQGLHVHGHWNVENQKISKSLGNLVDPHVMDEKYGFEGFRYYLLRDMSFGTDTGFSESGVVRRINDDLANDLGNLLNRSVSMTGRYFDGVVPEASEPGELAEVATRVAADVDRHVREFSTQRALTALWELVSAGNKYVDAQAPWKLAKEPEQRRELERVLYDVLESLRITAVLLAPFLPGTAARILGSLGDPPTAATLAEATRWGGLPAGTSTQVIPALFPRIDTD